MNTKKLVLTALTVTLLGSGAVYAKGGNNGNSADRGARDNGRNGHGVIASDLKWRNAAHASAQAFSNPDSDSAVGLLAALTSSAINEAYAAAGVSPIDTLRDEGDILEDISGIEDLMSFLDPVLDAEAYDALQKELDELNAELVLPDTLTALEGDPDKAKELADAEEGVALDELDEESIIALWELLEGK